MARAEIAVNAISRSGAAVAGTAGTSDGQKFKNNGETWLEVVNSNVASRVLTVETPVTIDGQAVADRSVTIPGSATLGGMVRVGPFPPNDYNQPAAPDEGYVYIDFPVSHESDLTVTAYRLP